MTDTRKNQVPANRPIVSRNGEVSTDWRKFFDRSFFSIEKELKELKEEIANLKERVSTLENP